MRLIDADALLKKHCRERAKGNCERCDWYGDSHCATEIFGTQIEAAPAVDAVALPCKIGDRVYVIRNYRGIRHPQEGIVNEMFLTPEMELMITVKNIARGKWGKTVFSTFEEAKKAIRS